MNAPFDLETKQPLAPAYYLLNYHCLKDGYRLGVTAIDHHLVIAPLETHNQYQQWILQPNFVVGAQGGGYCLMNCATGEFAKVPLKEKQFTTAAESHPFGQTDFCLTCWPAGNDQGNHLWTIQTATKGTAMDAAGKSCVYGTPVMLWDWHGGENQCWVFLPAL